MGDEVATLFDGPLDAHLLHRLVGGATEEFVGQRFRQVAAESLGHEGELREFAEGFDARDDGHRDARLAAAVDKSVVGRVVVEKLRHTVVRSQLHLAFEHLEIAFQVGRLFVLFGIARHTVGERLSRLSDGRAVDKSPGVELVHLHLQVGGVGVSAFGGVEHSVFPRLVATEQEEVFDAEDLHVEQSVFDVLAGVARAEHVGHEGNAAFALQHSRHGHGAGTSADVEAFHQAALHLAVDVFCAVVGDVDVFRLKFAQAVDGLAQAVDAVAFERREHFVGESGTVAGDEFWDGHRGKAEAFVGKEMPALRGLWLQKYEKNGTPSFWVGII